MGPKAASIFNCLGIESTAHTFGASIVSSSGEVFSNVKSAYKPKEGSGIIPMDCARHHEEAAGDILREAIGTRQFDIVAYSKGPGLGPVLRVGLATAKKLARENAVPLVGVNHCIGHIEIGKLKTGLTDPAILYVSGGNTQVIALVEGRYRVFGETLDITIGNALDVLARGLGLQYPGGPKIEALALEGKKLIELPYSVKGMDLSYSGLVTHCLRIAPKHDKADLCHSFQEHAFAMLVEVVERAIAHTGKREVLLTGGVAANRRLQEMLEIMCRERGVAFATVPREFAGDQGAMIAWTGCLMHEAGAGLEDPGKADIVQKFRTDEVDVVW